MQLLIQSLYAIFQSGILTLPTPTIHNNVSNPHAMLLLSLRRNQPLSLQCIPHQPTNLARVHGNPDARRFQRLDFIFRTCGTAGD